MGNDWTLHELGQNGAGEKLWSAGVNGPSVYLTCDEYVAREIVRRWNAEAAGIPTNAEALKAIRWICLWAPKSRI